MLSLCVFGVAGFLSQIVSAGQNCDQLGVLLYEDMGCKPMYDRSGSTCPTMFDCKGLKKSKKLCYFKDKGYKIDDQVDSSLTATSCDVGCYCTKKDNKMKFHCASVECPEWTQRPKNLNCYKSYSLDSCCSVRDVCPPYENSTRCLYDFKEYKPGDNILPRESCHRCVCQEGFNGELKPPFCRRRACNAQIKHQDKLQQACAPVYFKRMYRNDTIFCCPNNWVCTDHKEIIKGKPLSEKTCQFGSRKVRVGQNFVKDVEHLMLVKKVYCECRIPPLLTCTAEII